MEYKGKKTASLGPEKMHAAKDIYLWSKAEKGMQKDKQNQRRTELVTGV
jgi:hypothetical protein